VEARDIKKLMMKDLTQEADDEGPHLSRIMKDLIFHACALRKDGEERYQGRKDGE